jgi:hypothetical protein
MEQLLGVTYDASKYKTHEHWVESRMHTVEADALDQAEGDNSARTRYQRMFWEPVVEGQVCDPNALFLYLFVKRFSNQEPVLPSVLKRAREDAKRHGRTEDPVRSGDINLDFPHDSAKEVIRVDGATTGRSNIKFVDVGTKFMDPKEHMRRMKESQRRAKIRSKKVPKRHFAFV